MSKGDSTRGVGSGASRGLFPVLFAAAALCFLLPFGTVSCSGEDKVAVTGVELVSRTVPGAGATQGEPTLAQQVEDDGFVPAVVALVAVLLGLALVVTRPEAIGKAFLITLVGIVALLWLPGTAILELADFTLGPGFVLALVLELLLACACVFLLLRRRTDRVWTEPILPPGAVPRLTAGSRGPLDDR
jgi:hypothetical protein